MSKKGYLDWDKVEQRRNNNSDNNKKKDDVPYLKFKEGKYKIRLLGQAFFYDQHFISSAVTGAEWDIPVISPGADEDPLIPLGFEPSEKCAVNILDRKDGNSLKVMRVGPSVYNHIIQYAKDAEINPGDPKHGPDFIITVDDSKGKRNRKYTVVPVKVTPLTKAEAKAIKDAGGLHDLEELMAADPVDKINAIIKKYNITSNGDAGFDDSGSVAEDSEGMFDGDNEETEDDDFGF
jgi:hypothetical protein